MRRLLGLVLPALLAVALLMPTSVAYATPSDAATSLVLATEADAGASPPGRAPMGPNDEDNPGAPADYESNFLWGAAVGLFALTLLGVLVAGGLYYVLVHRPRQRAAAGRK